MSLANQLASVCLIAGLSVAALPSAYAAGASLTFHTTRITDIKLRKVKSGKSRTGYWFEISGTIIDTGKEELDWGRGLAICSSVKLIDNSGVKLSDQRCEFPELLPGQSKKGVIFAGGPAMPSATGAKLCYGHLWERRCTPILPLQK
jgi:hypothetical protein